ncbi:Nitrogen permease regulator 2 [Geranomyces variabilis]|uniref:Nitrogen permease regulator 2 n=1 Tax=Geranomyces variabilis TaxID=109894 RepID=A0AAD5TN20_9FUNG|nr:Nitrogen permease regulator 2 [Geranomyces variabilis]
MSIVEADVPTSVLSVLDDNTQSQRLGDMMRRCRIGKEQKIAAQRRWGHFQEEEVSLFEANVKEARQLYEQQLDEQRLSDDRQTEAAVDLLSSEARKRELVGIVSKIAAIKTHTACQDKARERELEFRARQKQKREAFDRRNRVIEATQVKEREELVSTQSRVSANLGIIHQLELRGMTDEEKRQHNKQYQLQYQQLKMRQQKEAEQLREVQLLKTRHLSEQMEMELLAATELEDLSSEHRTIEDTLLANQVMERSGEASKLDRQQAQLMAMQLKEDQKSAKGSLTHHQDRQRKMLERSQKFLAKQRERMMVDEAASMLADSGLKDTAGIGAGSNADTSDRDMSESHMSAGESALDATDAATREESGAGGEDHERRRKARSTKDAAAELAEALTKGVQRLKDLEISHKRLYESTRSQHKDQYSQKVREIKRKQSQLLKDQEDEVQAIRREQVADMEELFEILKQTQALHDEQVAKLGSSSRRNHISGAQGNVMPVSFVEDIKSGLTPAARMYNDAVVFRTAIAGFTSLTPKQRITTMQLVAQAFDNALRSNPDVCKVESTGDGYLLCAGLDDSGKAEKTSGQAAKANDESGNPEMLKRNVEIALDCIQSLQDAIGDIDAAALELPALALKVGVAHGAVSAGLLGGRVPLFRIFGGPVEKATGISAAAEPGGVLVTKDIKDALEGEGYALNPNTKDKGETFWYAGSP